ncbi:hypothetical protein ACH5RR_018289, partial [Cinchona calisaya]
ITRSGILETSTDDSTNNEDNKTDHTTTTSASNDESSHCPTTLMHDNEEANSNASTEVSDAIGAPTADDDYIDHNPLLNGYLLLDDDIELILNLYPDVENLGEEFYSNPDAF